MFPLSFCRVWLEIRGLDHLQHFLREQRDVAAADPMRLSGRKGRSARHVSARTETRHVPGPLQQTGLPPQVRSIAMFT